jgi:transcriptional regulator with XRE-family HTH domain
MREPTTFRATKLASVMDAQGRKARWLATEVGISESHLSRVLKGERLISEPLANKIADKLQMPLFLVFEFTSVNSSLRMESAVA